MRAFKDLAELQRIMSQSHDILRIDKPHVMDAFDELSKILFAKLQDEREVKQGVKQQYQFLVESGETAEQTAQKISILFRIANTRYPEIFENSNEHIDLRPTVLLKLVGLLSCFSLLDTPIDVKGATYEEFLKSALPVGKIVGQFFTPREIVNFCIAVLDPTIQDIIIDPACGSGGFLLAALRHAWRHLVSLRKESAENYQKEKISFISDNLYGVDIDPRMVRIARMNIFMHGNDNVTRAKNPGRIVTDNGLSYSEKLPELKGVKATIALTNPPFGSIEFDYAILRLFRLGQNRNSRSSPILFLERCLQLLAPGGKLAIVIPDPILSGTSTSDVRDLIRKESIVRAVVKLPSETFLPYGSSAESSILFLEKKDGLREQNNIFMAESRFVGYNRVGEIIEKNDLTKILSSFRLFQDGVNVHDEDPITFVVSKEELFDRLDVRRYWHPTYDNITQVLSRSVYPVRQIREVVTFKKELINPRKDFPQTQFRYIGLGNIEPRTGRLVYNESEKSQRGRMLMFHKELSGSELQGSCQKIEAGDVIYGKLRPYLRKSFLVSDYGVPAICSTEFIVIKSKKHIEGKYLAYVLRTNLVLEQLRHLYTGLGRPRVSQRDLGNVKIPVPDDLIVQLGIAEMGSKKEGEAISNRTEAKALLRRSDEILDDSENKLLQIVESGYSSFG
ncbi:N-6 DNA methylase [Candidatus Bathyarchaeota archaeon]|nr:N-6 DNA methylase [Candidatus Bathyarchaeota archaeon]